MIFEIKNIGAIKEAQIEMGNLTVICGKNNTGKTYLTYAIYGFLTSWASLTTKKNRDISSKLVFDKITSEYNDLITVDTHHKSEINVFFKYICKEYIKIIHRFFSANTDEFIRSELGLIDFNFYYRKKEIRDEMFKTKALGSQRAEDMIILSLQELKNIFDNIFILTAERTQTRLFQKELDITRNELITEKKFEILEKNLSNISIPIRDNLDFARETDRIIKSNSFLKEQYPELLQEIEEILGVSYEVNDGMLRIYDKKANHTIPHYMASTSVRSLADMHLWLKHIVQKGDLLMIDEPELNLHPENQIKMARLFAKLVNVGIKVWITTHSDYIVKEVNNLLMFSNDFPEKEEIMKDFGYQENEILKKEDVRMYIAEGGTVEKVGIDHLGMVKTTFDDTIRQINAVSNALFNVLS